MKRRERLLNALRGQKADRVPLHLEGFAAASREEIEQMSDPARREVCHRIYDETCAIFRFNSSVNRYLVTPPHLMRQVERHRENGNEVVVTEIETPKGPLTAVTCHNPLISTTWTRKYPVESLSDIEKIRSVPWDGAGHVERPDRSSLPADFAERIVAATGVSSPFVCVAGMMPYQYFLELTLTERKLIRELTEICTNRILDVLDVVLADGVIEYVWMGGCEWVTPPMASLEVYEELVQGPESEIIRRIHLGGALAHVHCHGNVRSTIELVMARGADFFEPVEPPPVAWCWAGIWRRASSNAGTWMRSRGPSGRLSREARAAWSCATPPGRWAR